MTDLRVISAGAGTGKTHRLAQELLAALTDPVASVEPEGVVAVTYTRSAAAELETRVRTALIDAGRVDLARRLAAARIGTVHSVCARLIEEHAFALGLSPELETIDDVLAAGLFEDALAASITDAERLTIDQLEQRFSLGTDASGFFKSVRQVVDRARSNEFNDDDLERSRDASLASLLENLTATRSATEVEQGLLRALHRAVDQASDKGSDSWRDAVDVARRMVRRLEQGEVLSWSEWLQLEDSRFGGVRTAAKLHVEHQGLRADLTTMGQLVFDVARRTMQRYSDDKRAAGVVDFTDLERMALQAVQTPEVNDALRTDVQLLLVDEFQDTNPLQMQLFDALRRVASRTVIVGDEKQSIFGFRDARPELFMRMADEADHKDRLGVSYRSRPGLVRAVSAVFAAAFADQRRPEDVVLTAALVHEPPGLGAHVERWAEALSQMPGGGERAKDEEVIAAGIAEALSTRDIPVRPTSSTSSDGLIRPAQARDFAVLCRSNSECRAVARALNRRGVPATLGRRGLAKTFEARLISAALALWLDPRDALARISLVHLAAGKDADVGNGNGNGNGNDNGTVVTDVATAERGQALVDHPLVTTLTAAATAAPFAGLVLAFDRAVDVLRLTDRLAALPGPAQRLADLAALRALAVRFVDECFARGRGPTIAGYLDRLESLRTASREDEQSDDDNRGAVAGEDTVSILTYHRAKGKEWPVVILAGLWSSPWVVPFQPVVEATVTVSDLSRPSFDRTLRAWPSPYSDRAKGKGGLHQVLKASPAVIRAEKNTTEEGRRLLYVGFTRARDRLVIFGDQAVWSRGLMSTLVVNGRPLCSDPISPVGTVGTARWAGVDIDACVHHPNLGSRLPPRGAPLVMPPHPAGPRPVRAPMFMQPSAQEGTGSAGESITLGGDVTVTATSREELNPLGQCVHAFLAWDAFVDVKTDDDDSRRRHRAQQMLERFEVNDRASTQQLITMADRLWHALQARFPGHRRRTEVPMLQRLPSGSLMRGQLDLLLDLPDGGAVIVDHKTTWDGDVAGYAGQLQAYRSAVVAAGATSVSTWIHLPLLGRLVEVATTNTLTVTTS